MNNILGSRSTPYGVVKTKKYKIVFLNKPNPIPKYTCCVPKTWGSRNEPKTQLGEDENKKKIGFIRIT